MEPLRTTGQHERKAARTRSRRRRRLPRRLRRPGRRLTVPVGDRGGYPPAQQHVARGCAPITLLVEGILIYTVWKFRNSDEAKPTKENRRLEITWTVATAVVLLFVGVAAYGVMGQTAVTATQADAEAAIAQDDTVVVDTIGVQWYWKYSYPEEDLTVSSGAATEGWTSGTNPWSSRSTRNW